MEACTENSISLLTIAQHPLLLCDLLFPWEICPREIVHGSHNQSEFRRTFFSSSKIHMQCHKSCSCCDGVGVSALQVTWADRVVDIENTVCASNKERSFFRALMKLTWWQTSFCSFKQKRRKIKRKEERIRQTLNFSEKYKYSITLPSAAVGTKGKERSANFT